jgi:5-methylcytosine-specific restriction endonuclease McrA
MIRLNRICPICNIQFEATSHKGGSPQVYCSPKCRSVAKDRRCYQTEEGRQRRIASVRRYQRTEKGRQNYSECRQRYLQSEKGKQKIARHNKRYSQTENGKRVNREKVHHYLNTARGKERHHQWLHSDNGKKSRNRYLKSERGKTMLRKRAERLGWSNLDWKDIENYWIYVEGRGCSTCGEGNQPLLQCDHIIPRALWMILHEGNMQGCHADSNLQIICKSCHKSKTIEDMKLIRAVKKARLEMVLS